MGASEASNISSGEATYTSDVLVDVPVIRHTLLVLHIVAIVMATLGNGWLIYALLSNWRKKHRHNVTVYLVLNLAVTEFLRTVFHQPLRLVDILLDQDQPGHPDSNGATTARLISNPEVYCKASGFFTAFFACVAFHTITGISQERLLLICYPLRAQGLLTVAGTRTLVIAIWVVAFLASLPLPILFSSVASVQFESKNVTFCFMDMSAKSSYCSYYLLLFIAYYALPVIAITTSYSRIFYTLNRATIISGNATDSPKDCIGRNILVTRRALSKVMLSIAVIFTLCHGPYFLTFLASCLGVEIRNNPVFLLVMIEFLPLVSSTLTPFMYTAYSGLWPLGHKDSGDGENGPQDHKYHFKENNH